MAKIVTIARAGTSLLTGLHVATVQSLTEVVGTGFPWGMAAAGPGQGVRLAGSTL